MKTIKKYEPSENHPGRTLRHAVNGPLAYASGLLLTVLLAAAVSAAPVGVGGSQSGEATRMGLISCSPSQIWEFIQINRHQEKIIKQTLDSATRIARLVVNKARKESQ